MLFNRFNWRCVLLCAAISGTLFFSCKKEDTRSNLAGFTSFSIEELEDVSFTIDETQQKIFNADSLPFEYDASALTAVFGLVPNATVSVNGSPQVSGATVNDFSSPVTYVVTAEDGITTRQYNVQVNVSKIDPQAVSWQRAAATAPFGAYHQLSGGFYNGKYYVVGSTIGSFGAHTFGIHESADGVSWTRLKAADNNSDSLPIGENSTFVANFNNKMWLMGGHKPASGFNFSAVVNKVWSSSNGKDWTVSEAAAPADRWSIRERINALVFNNKLWVIGGNAYPSFGNTNNWGAAYNDVWSTGDGNTWTKIKDAADFLPRSNPASFVFDNKMWIVGGIDNGRNYLNDIWYSTDGATWTQVTTQTTFTPRHGHKIIVNNDQLLLIGGENADGVHNDMWVSEDKGVNWTKIETGDSRALPANFNGRIHFSLFRGETDIWIMGGLGPKNDNNQYTTASDIWKGTFN